MVNFKDLRTKSPQESLKRLSEDMEKLTNNTNNKDSIGDDRYWKPKADEHGNGSAIIRFLPPSKADGVAGVNMVKYFGYGFQGPSGKWYIEKSRSTLGKEFSDPVMELNSRLWKEGEYDDKNSPERKQARAQKRHQHYVANIYVIKHTNRPEDEGKNFLWDFGPAIFNNIEAVRNPPMDDLTGQPLREALNPFDLYNGADFYLRFHVDTKKKQRTYENSSWGNSRQFLESDDEMEKIWESEYSLTEIVAPEAFKSYEELEKRLNFVLGNAPVRKPVEDRIPETPAREQRSTPSPFDKKPTTFADESDDFDPEKFAKLLDDMDDDI